MTARSTRTTTAAATINARAAGLRIGAPTADDLDGWLGGRLQRMAA